MVLTLQNYAEGRWVTGAGNLQPILSAVTGEAVAETSAEGLDFGAMTAFARNKGGPELRATTFHQRAAMLKAAALKIMEHKEALYELSYATGATRADSWIDIEGGAGTFFVYSSKAKKELPNDHVIIDGNMEGLSKTGSFIGQHVYTSMQGVSIQINAFNFPIWGMMEKMAPCILAGVPVIVKPATSTGYLAEAAFRILVEANVFPEGAIQFVSGSPGNLLDLLGCQDNIAFTGSARTSIKLQSHPLIASESVRFSAERDSLNGSILGPDAQSGTPEFDLFVKEVVKEMTSKAGQKCTAIRRAIVPVGQMDSVQDAIVACLEETVVGDPRLENVRMGALASQAQLDDIQAKVAQLSAHAPVVFGDTGSVELEGSGLDNGAFVSPILMRCDKPWETSDIHDVEAFGPVATIMPYNDINDAVQLANRGMGSLALSIFTHDNQTAKDIVMGAGSFHGRMVMINRDNAKESTGHGSPLPVMVHGGPGRAGGSEELGGIRGVKHFMQRTALQGTPSMISSIINQYLPGAQQTEAGEHPFRKTMSVLDIGYTLKTAERTVSLEDIEHFAEFTGDNFYAHMDEVAAAASPIFGGRVAHGYLILSFAAGLFVEPNPGPVLANFGLEGLRFVTPLKPDDRMKVSLTVKSKKLRTKDMGEVRWAVAVTNQNDELVATYDLLTMNEA